LVYAVESGNNFMAGEPVQRRLQFVLQHFDKRPTENVILNYFGLANEVYTITTA